MAKEVQIKGAPALFIALSLLLLSIAGFVASWGVLYHAWVWAF